jgi:AcrR family transcriptional regulator
MTNDKVPRGRPRSFDRTIALRRALEVFLAKGFEGASLTHLTDAMDINSPSVYAAFGSKEELFREAIDLYLAEFGSAIWDILAEMPTARDAVESLLRNTVDVFTTPGNPRGCPIVSSAVNCQTPGVRTFLREKRGASLKALRSRLERGVSDGDLPRKANVEAVTEFYGTVQQGLALRARDGLSRDALLGIVKVAMAAWNAATSGRNLKGSGGIRKGRVL